MLSDKHPAMDLTRTFVVVLAAIKLTGAIDDSWLDVARVAACFGAGAFAAEYAWYAASNLVRRWQKRRKPKGVLIDELTSDNAGWMRMGRSE